MTDSPASLPAIGAETPLRFLPRAMRVPEKPFKAIAVGWLVAFPASLLIALLGSVLLPNLKAPDFPMHGWLAVYMLVVFSPVVETFIMGTVLMVLLRFLPPVVAIVISCLGWGVAHSLMAPAWGLVIWWPFLVFSTLFAAWKQRSLLLAFAIPASVHALQNLLPAILIAWGLSS